MIRTLALLLALVAAVFGEPPQSARERYDLVYPHFLNSSTAPQANEDATYAWGASYGMLADVSVYAATRDTVYLDRALDKMANVLANRDDRRGVVDYRGVSMAAWRDIHYQLPAGVTYKFGDPNNDKYAYCYVVHSGMITYPMAALAELILNAKVAGGYKGQSYQDWGNYLIARTRETIAAHDDQWTDYGADEGYYHFRDVPSNFSWYANRNRDIPFNQSHALGETLLILYRLTGEDQYLHKALRLATRFKRSLAVGPAGAYIWLYWETPGVYTVTGTTEDISHGAINIDCARLAYETGVVFDKHDMRRFALTLTQNVLEPTERAMSDCGKKFQIPDVSDYVAGGTKNMNTYWTTPGRWLMLSGFDVQAYPRIARLYDYYYAAIMCSSRFTDSESDLLGFAGLTLYAPAHRQDVPDR